MTLTNRIRKLQPLIQLSTRQKQARSSSSSEEHCSTTDLNNSSSFPAQICDTDARLIRFRFQSWHSRMKTYYTCFEFTWHRIRNSCCDCPIVDRMDGMCSHRAAAAAIWFWGCQHYSNDVRISRSSGTYLKHLDDSKRVSDCVDPWDKGEEDLRYFLSRKKTIILNKQVWLSRDRVRRPKLICERLIFCSDFYKIFMIL